MAIIPCTECGCSVSDKALACPKCGCSVVANVSRQQSVNLGTSSTRYIHIVDIAGYKKGLFTWFYIYLKNGKKIKFAVWDKNTIIRSIETRRAALFQKTGLEVPPARII